MKLYAQLCTLLYLEQSITPNSHIKIDYWTCYQVSYYKSKTNGALSDRQEVSTTMEMIILLNLKEDEYHLL